MNTDGTRATAAAGPVLSEGLGPLPAEECLWGDDNVYGYSAEAMEAERQRCYALGVADGIAQERNRCRYPQCVENEDERCPRWLTGECAGPNG